MSEPGTVLNVSLTGAAIRGPADLPFAVGTTVLIRYEGHDNSVVIRRSETTEDADMHLYGVELKVSTRCSRSGSGARSPRPGTRPSRASIPPAEDTFLL